MLYQKLLVGADSYFFSIGKAQAFELHCHPEIELSYCYRGSYNIIADDREYTLTQGDLFIVNPLVPHELGNRITEDCLRLTIEVGPAFLGEQFELFVSAAPTNRLISLGRETGDPLHLQLRALLDETAVLSMEKDPFYKLLVKGNLYKISAYILKTRSETAPSETVFKSLADIEKIGRVINMIYNRYSEALDLDMACALCGYSKSNFCKTFKAITGKSFHTLLNRHRIDIACLRLKESPASIEEIAQQSGFADTKNFCRAFKKTMGQTAGEYRKAARAAARGVGTEP